MVIAPPWFSNSKLEGRQLNVVVAGAAVVPKAEMRQHFGFGTAGTTMPGAVAAVGRPNCPPRFSHQAMSSAGERGADDIDVSVPVHIPGYSRMLALKKRRIDEVCLVQEGAIPRLRSPTKPSRFVRAPLATHVDIAVPIDICGMRTDRAPSRIRTVRPRALRPEPCRPQQCSQTRATPAVLAHRRRCRGLRLRSTSTPQTA